MTTANGINSDDFSREDLITAYRVQKYFNLTGYTGSVGNVTFDARCSLFLGGGGLSANGNSKDNVAVGFQALYDNAGGCSNTALGTQALFANSMGSNNFAQGKCALYSNGYGCNNTAIGYQSLGLNDDGSNNIAVGCQSLFNNRSGCNNVALGHRSQYCNNYGNNNNVSIGQCSAYRLQRTGGSEAGYGYGNNNIAIGCRSLANTCNGSNNIALGNVALCANISGNNNVAIGNSALMRANSYGGHGGNIAIGVSAGCSITTGISNTIIGSLPAASGCACTVLIGAGACERMRVDNTGLYINGNPVAVDRLTTGSYSVVLGSTGTLTLPRGGTIGETTTTMVISPPGALVGQSLVIRPTAGTFALSTDHPSGFVPGESITITAIDLTGNAGGTLDYEFTGATTQQLGTGTTGTLVIEATSTTTSLTWTIPALSSMTTFTFALTTATGFGGTSGLPIDITVTLDGSAVTENNHIHMLSGDPVTVDLYLGDDDQYVKIEKNAGDVVIGTLSVLTSATSVTFSSGGWDYEPYTGMSTTGGYGNGLTVDVTQSGGYVQSVAIVNPGSGYQNGDTITVSGTHSESATFTISVAKSNRTWDFGTDGSLTFPDSTVQSSAYPGVLVPANGDGVSGVANLVFYAGDWYNTSKVGINPASGMLTLSGTGGAGGIILPNSGVIDVGSQFGTTSGLTRKIYSEDLGLSIPTYSELAEAIATWTPDTIDIVNPISWSGIPVQTWELTGYFRAPVTGIYTFDASVDDYYFIVIDNDDSPAPVENTPVVITLTQGQIVSYKMLYANVYTQGTLTLQWKNDTSQPTYTSDFGGLVATSLGTAVDITVDNKTWAFGENGTTTLPTVPWNYEARTFTGVDVYGEATLTFTVLGDNTFSNMKVEVGSGGYGADNQLLTVLGTTFPGGTTPANDIVFNATTFPVPDFPSEITTASVVTYVSGTPPARYDNIASTGSVGIGAGDEHWIFGTDGELTLPGGQQIGGSDSTRGIALTTDRGTVLFGNIPDNPITASSHFHIMKDGYNSAVDLFFGDDYNYVKLPTTQGVEIGANGSVWKFGTDGTLALPVDNSYGAISVISDTNGYINQTSVTVITSGTNYLGNSSYATDYPNTIVYIPAGPVSLINGNFVIQSTDVFDIGDVITIPAGIQGNTTATVEVVSILPKKWKFNSNGSLTFPDSTIQTTAWTGTINSTTASTSTTTGALVIAGGVGVGGNLYVGGEIVAQKLTIELTTVTTILIQTDDIIQTTNATVSTSTTTGALTVAGGVGVGGGMFVGGTVTATNITSVATAGTTSTTAAALGYIGMPQNSTATSYTLVAGDQGKHIYISATGQTITIPANTAVAFPIGTTIAFIAGPSATTVTIAITTDTMYLGGTGTTGNRTLAAYGMATAVKVTSTTWFINGTGLT